MIDRGWERITGLMGIAAGLIAVGALATWRNPQVTDPLSKITDYYVHNSHMVFLSQYLIVLFGIVAVGFATGLRTIFLRAGGESLGLCPLIVGAAILNAVWMMVWAAINDGLALEAGQAPVHALRLMLAVEYSVDSLTGYSMALLPLVAGLTMVRGAIFSRWLGWLGVASGALCVVGEIGNLDLSATTGVIGGIGNLAFLGQMLFLIWLIALGVSLLRRSPIPAATRAQTRPAEPMPA